MAEVSPEIRLRLCIEDLLRGRVPLFDGVEKLLRLADELPSLAHDRDRRKLVEILAEADHLPVGEARSHWQAEALHRADRELMALERQRQESVFYASRRMLSTLDTATRS